MATTTDPKGLQSPSEAEEKDYKPYEPSEQDKACIADIDDKCSRWGDVRKPHESTWFINAAFYRGSPSDYRRRASTHTAAPDRRRH